MTQPIHPGFFGKIPSNGDFVSRQLPRTFIDPWDEWLQQCVATSRELLTGQWLEAYLTAPIYRFALSGGICGEQRMIGLLMPSVDNAGRYFPLTLATPVPGDVALLPIADKEESWFESLEDTALSALDQHNSLDSLIERIENIGLPESINAAEPIQDINPGQVEDKYWRIAMNMDTSLSENLQPMLEQCLGARFPQFSLWWTGGSHQVNPSLLVCNGLPAAENYCAFITGNWDKWGWHDLFSAHPDGYDPAGENSTVIPP